jgi:Ubiquitin elongating factor core
VAGIVGVSSALVCARVCAHAPVYSRFTFDVLSAVLSFVSVFPWFLGRLVYVCVCVCVFAAMCRCVVLCGSSCFPYRLCTSLSYFLLLFPSHQSIAHRVIKLNKPRTQTYADFQNTFRTGMYLNLFAVLLRLCEPFLHKQRNYLPVGTPHHITAVLLSALRG